MSTRVFPHRKRSDDAYGQLPTGYDQLADKMQGFLSVETDGDDTVAGPSGGRNFHFSDTGAYFVTPQLKPVTISGTITIHVWGRETDALANVGPHVEIYRTDSNGDYISTVLDSASGVEFATVAGPVEWTATPTSTTLADGDRLIMYLEYRDAGGTEAAGWVTFVEVDGPSLMQGDTWFQFTETLVEYPTSANRFRMKTGSLVKGQPQTPLARTGIPATGGPLIQIPRTGTAGIRPPRGGDGF